MQSLSSMAAQRKMCLPTGRPRTWSSCGRAKRKRRTSWEMDILSTSLHGIFSRGISATLRWGASSRSFFALSEWMASNSSVQSVPALMRMLSVPPGWSLRKRVQS
nr:hypothetical protein Iba_scaffold8547CG0030 [Ipomoea batatas]